MWNIKPPIPGKLIVGILACNDEVIHVATGLLEDKFGEIDLQSPIYQFDHTDYYRHQTGTNIRRKFVTFRKLFDPGKLAEMKYQTVLLEKQLAAELHYGVPRPVNLDPGILEPSKLVLASTKNFAHRIYIGMNIYAEVTLTYNKGTWESYPFTFPDYKSGLYNDFLNVSRETLVDQLRRDY